MKHYHSHPAMFTLHLNTGWQKKTSGFNFSSGYLLHFQGRSTCKIQLIALAIHEYSTTELTYINILFLFEGS